MMKVMSIHEMVTASMSRLPDHVNKCPIALKNNIRATQEVGFVEAFHDIHNLHAHSEGETKKVFEEMLHKLMKGTYSKYEFVGDGSLVFMDAMIEDAEKTGDIQFVKNVKHCVYVHNFVLKNGQTYMQRRALYLKEIQ